MLARVPTVLEKMKNIPGEKKRRFYERKWLVELIAVVPPIVAGAYAARYAALSPTTAPYAPWLWAGIAWLVAASVVKVVHAYRQDAEAKALEDHDGLAAALHVLRAAVAAKSGVTASDDGALRITIHRVVPPLDAPKEYQQLLSYIGGPGGKVYRRFPISTGLVGRVAREGAIYVHSRRNDDYGAYVAELVQDWGYVEADAKTLMMNRKSSMGVPIFQAPKVVEAVVYLDSDRKDIFTDEVKVMVMNGCKGLATYIRERYK